MLDRAKDWLAVALVALVLAALALTVPALVTVLAARAL